MRTFRGRLLKSTRLKPRQCQRDDIQHWSFPLSLLDLREVRPTRPKTSLKSGKLVGCQLNLSWLLISPNLIAHEPVYPICLENEHLTRCFGRPRQWSADPQDPSNGQIFRYQQHSWPPPTMHRIWPDLFQCENWKHRIVLTTHVSNLYSRWISCIAFLADQNIATIIDVAHSDFYIPSNLNENNVLYRNCRFDRISKKISLRCLDKPFDGEITLANVSLINAAGVSFTCVMQLHSIVSIDPFSSYPSLSPVHHLGSEAASP